MKKFIFCFISLSFVFDAVSQRAGSFNGVEVNMGNLFRLSDAKTRSISPENFNGEKGRGGMATTGTGLNASRDLGQGWKVSPSVQIEPGKIFTIAEITGPGAIQHIWMTPTGNWRFSILRFYWDDEKEPSVEVPVGDFFGMGWGEYAHLNSLAVTVNPGSAFNCYWVMPFRKKCRITMENIAAERMTVYYQVDYTLTTVPDDAAYFHAQFRRSNPNVGSLYTLVDNIKGKGQYV
ncbi:MAG: glycoside hydrolase family 172 protein, partial [Segetibacter sp.]